MAQRTRHKYLAGDERKLPTVRWMILSLVLIALIAAGVGVVGEPPSAKKAGAPIPAVEFARVVRDFSEPGGYFRSDNFVSNETSYLHVVDLLAEKNVIGGAYIGVGPEQNFTYIAKIHPRLVFLVDIRRQAVLQHLMYKAIFYLAKSRRDFLSILLSRPIDPANAPGPEASLNELVDYFWRKSTDSRYFEKNLEKILRHIERECYLPLAPADVAGIQYIYSAFRENGLDIRYRVGRNINTSFGYRRYWGGRFPNLAELLLESDLNGKQRGFLASDEDFHFVKDLHRRNRIIPIVGDFAGTKALRAVAAYLKKKRLKLKAFYVSNVEQYLYQYNGFSQFAENVKSLPFDDDSVIIRSIAGRRMRHPANVPGHRLTTTLQRVTDFVDAYNHGKLPSYWDLVTTDYMAARPRSELKKP